MDPVIWDLVTPLKKDGRLGLRKASQLNLVGLPKLNWRIVKETQQPWVQMARTRYVDETQFGENRQLVLKPYRWSSIHKALNEGLDLFNKRIYWIPGNGHTIQFWIENWFGLVPLRNLVEGPLQPLEESTPLTLQLPNMIFHQLCKIPISKVANQTNTIAWMKLRMANLAAKLAFRSCNRNHQRRHEMP